MAARTFAEVPPTSATIALNAYIYGYGGHSLVTPHATLKRLWWTTERIEAKCTRAFVLSKLRGQEREFLDQVVGFGEQSRSQSQLKRQPSRKVLRGAENANGREESPGKLADDSDDSDDLNGLTSSTYMDWILTRTRRLFLILAEIGVPDQIFGCIDDLWDDDDLPLTLEHVRNLDLTVDDDPVLERKFYDAQFVYLLRELRAGEHIDYNAREYIPIEHVDKVPPAVTMQEYGGRVHLPGRPDEVYMRRKIMLLEEHGKEDGGDDNGDFNGSDRSEGERGLAERQFDTAAFKRDIVKAQTLAHPHIAPVWASFTCHDAGFVLSDFVGEHTLGTFLDHRSPPSFARLPEPERPILLIEWMLCLADALSSLHDHGEAHTTICPSNIWIDRDNQIVFADTGRLPSFQRAKKYAKDELNHYAAPESPLRRKVSITGAPGSPSSPKSRPTSRGAEAFNIIRRASGRRDSSASFAGARLPSPSASPRGGSARNSASRSPTANTAQRTWSRPRSMSHSEVVDSSRRTQTPSVTMMPLDSEISSHPHHRNFSRQFRLTPPAASLAQIDTTNSSSHRNDATDISPRRPSTASPILASPASITFSNFETTTAMALTPEMSDIFSLACIYLNVITFLLEGRITEFVRHRSYALNIFKQRRYRTDQSFASDPEILEAWIKHLEAECEEKAAAAAAVGGTQSTGLAAGQDSVVQSEATKSYCGQEGMWRTGVPELLRLTRKMLEHDPLARPTARDVKGQIEAVLRENCGVARRRCLRCEGSEEEVHACADAGNALPEHAGNAKMTTAKSSVAVDNGRGTPASSTTTASSPAVGPAPFHHQSQSIGLLSDSKINLHRHDELDPPRAPFRANRAASLSTRITPHIASFSSSPASSTRTSAIPPDILRRRDSARPASSGCVSGSGGSSTSDEPGRDRSATRAAKAFNPTTAPTILPVSGKLQKMQVMDESAPLKGTRIKKKSGGGNGGGSSGGGFKALRNVFLRAPWAVAAVN